MAFVMDKEIRKRVAVRFLKAARPCNDCKFNGISMADKTLSAQKRVRRMLPMAYPIPKLPSIQGTLPLPYYFQKIFCALKKYFQGLKKLFQSMKKLFQALEKIFSSMCVLFENNGVRPMPSMRSIK